MIQKTHEKYFARIRHNTDPAVSWPVSGWAALRAQLSSDGYEVALRARLRAAPPLLRLDELRAAHNLTSPLALWYTQPPSPHPKVEPSPSPSPGQPGTRSRPARPTAASQAARRSSLRSRSCWGCGTRCAAAATTACTSSLAGGGRCSSSTPSSARTPSPRPTRPSRRRPRRSSRPAASAAPSRGWRAPVGCAHQLYERGC